ncbi:hypothetical protein T439DRAFT_354489 [Meredithblackwellia eburnea MCA 4105]
MPAQRNNTKTANTKPYDRRPADSAAAAPNPKGPLSTAAEIGRLIISVFLERCSKKADRLVKIALAEAENIKSPLDFLNLVRQCCEIAIACLRDDEAVDELADRLGKALYPHLRDIIFGDSDRPGGPQNLIGFVEVAVETVGKTYGKVWKGDRLLSHYIGTYMKRFIQEVRDRTQNNVRNGEGRVTLRGPTRLDLNFKVSDDSALPSGYNLLHPHFFR